MGMRLWHQSMTVLSDLPGYETAMRERIDSVVRDGTEVVLHGFIPGSFPANYPGPDIAFDYLYWLHSNQWVAAALQAEKQGYDAMVLGSMPSPMIREMRTLVDIPIVGYGDAVFRLAGMYGRRFGLLFFNVERAEFWPQRIREWGLAESFAGIRPAGVTFNEVVGGHGDPSKRDEVVQRVIASGEALAREHGADVIIPGEMPLNLLLARAGVSQIGGATVMDGLSAVFKMAELAVDLRRTSGMMQSRRGFFHAAPDRDRVAKALEFYGLDHLEKKFAEM